MLPFPSLLSLHLCFPSISYLYVLTTLLLIASFLTHPPQIPLYFNYTYLFKFPQISFACSYLSPYIMFPLPNNFLAILIIAKRYHSRFGMYLQCLRTAFPSLSPSGQTSTPTLHCPSLDVNTSHAVIPFLTSVSPQIPPLPPLSPL